MTELRGELRDAQQGLQRAAQQDAQRSDETSQLQATVSAQREQLDRLKSDAADLRAQLAASVPNSEAERRLAEADAKWERKLESQAQHAVTDSSNAVESVRSEWKARLEEAQSAHAAALAKTEAQAQATLQDRITSTERYYQATVETREAACADLKARLAEANDQVAKLQASMDELQRTTQLTAASAREQEARHTEQLQSALEEAEQTLNTIRSQYQADKLQWQDTLAKTHSQYVTASNQAARDFANQLSDANTKWQVQSAADEQRAIDQTKAAAQSELVAQLAAQKAHLLSEAEVERQSAVEAACTKLKEAHALQLDSATKELRAEHQQALEAARAQWNETAEGLKRDQEQRCAAVKQKAAQRVQAAVAECEKKWKMGALQARDRSKEQLERVVQEAQLGLQQALDQKAALEQQLDSLRAEIASIRAHSQSRDAEHADQVAQLNQELAEAKYAIEEHRERYLVLLNSQHHQSSESQRATQALETRHKQALAESRSAQASVGVMEYCMRVSPLTYRQASAQQEQNRRLELHLQSSRAETKQLQSELQRLQEERTEAIKRARSIEQAKAELAASMSSEIQALQVQHEGEIDALQHTIRELEHEMERQGEVAALDQMSWQARSEGLHRSVVKLTTQQQATEASEESLTHRVKELSQQLEQDGVRLSEAQNELSLAHKRAEELEAAVQELKLECQEVSTQRQDAVSACRRLQASTEALQQQLYDSKDIRDSLEADISTLRASEQDEQTLVRQLQEDLAVQQQERVTLNAEVRKWKQRCEELEAHHATALRQAVEAQSSRIEALLESQQAALRDELESEHQAVVRRMSAEAEMRL